MTRMVIDPITRIEGHLRIDTENQGGEIVDAWSRGEMFRGFEAVLTGRDPFDAPVITQRICGVCPVSHGIASCEALENAFAIEIPENARLQRNLILGANFIASHLTHFYQLSALDFIRIESLLDYRGSNSTLNHLKGWAEQEISSRKILPVAPFLPHLEGDYPKDQKWNIQALEHYLQSLEIRKESHKMAALFGGKMPHTATLVAGGVTSSVQADVVENFRTRLLRVRQFVDDVYLPDVQRAAELFPAYRRMGAGVKSYLSFGVFDENGHDFLPSGFLNEGQLHSLDLSLIREGTRYSRYRDGAPKHPSVGVTEPDPDKEGGYSWLKAPRYGGSACEVGPLARLLIAAHHNVFPLTQQLRRLGWKEAELNSVMGRHLARALETAWIARRMEEWLDRLRGGEATVSSYGPSLSGQGEGLIEAPRGALGHWIHVEKGRIRRYQCIVPSTWNFSPAGEKGDKGPVETALIGTSVARESQGLEAARVVRSFDPCIACAIH